MTTLPAPVLRDGGMDNDTVVQMTSLRVQYRQLTTFAAILERAGHYLEAAEQWRQAERMAPGAQSRFWCEARQAWCLRRISLAPQSYRQAGRKRVCTPGPERHWG